MTVYRISKWTMKVRKDIKFRCLEDYFARKRFEIYTDSQIKIRYHYLRYKRVSRAKIILNSH